MARPFPRLLGLLLLAAALAGSPARAEFAGGGQVVAPGMLCRQAIVAAERTSGIPDHLLTAIARVESGRRDPGTGNWAPWPWTINVEGVGHFYDTKAEAIAAVRAFQAQGARSIDVGCMQVSLLYHPDAFPSLEAAFDPQVNANWASHFLQGLYQQGGTWQRAAGLYHSATPALGAEYQQRVMAVLPEEQKNAELASLGPPLGASFGAMPRPAFSTPLLGLGGMRLLNPAPAPHVIPLAGAGPQPAMAAAAGAGRGLDAYRAAPIALAMRAPVRTVN